MMIFDHLSHAKKSFSPKFSPISVLPITKLAIRNKFKNAWLKQGFVY